jgi:hypothetical protein
MKMTGCHEMKAGQTYICEDCGLELKVVKECTECGTEDAMCSVESCTFACCGEPLKLKEED